MSTVPKSIPRTPDEVSTQATHPERATTLPNNFKSPWLQRLKPHLALHRFFTFPFNFELETKLNRVDLANSGLYLSECQNLLICYFCRGEIKFSTLPLGLSGDGIDNEHQKLSVNCPLFTETTENVPMVPSNCTNYKYEACRLFSLLMVHWRAPVSIYDLAHFGFYYANIEDNVRCVFCKLEVRGWEPQDTAEGEHQRWNPQCPFLKLHQDVSNVPIGDEFLASSLNATNFDFMPSNSTTGISSLLKFVQDEKNLVILTSRNKISPETLGIVEVTQLKSPSFVSISARLLSFNSWPKSLAQKPLHLAEAGFYYTGIGDRVCCFYCGLGLKDWQEKDTPWKEHVAWSTVCSFTLMVKGQQFVNQMLHKTHSDSVEFENESISRSIPASLLCKLCNQQDVNAVNLPCGHIEKCMECSNKNKICGVCKLETKASLRIYMN